MVRNDGPVPKMLSYWKLLMLGPTEVLQHIRTRFLRSTRCRGLKGGRCHRVSRRKAFRFGFAVAFIIVTAADCFGMAEIPSAVTSPRLVPQYSAAPALHAETQWCFRESRHTHSHPKKHPAVPVDWAGGVSISTCYRSSKPSRRRSAYFFSTGSHCTTSTITWPSVPSLEISTLASSPSLKVKVPTGWR
jgi:hypothetical protein